jgi:hypothetical protein
MAAANLTCLPVCIPSHSRMALKIWFSVRGRLRRVGVVSHCRSLGEWWLSSSVETSGQDTWKVDRAAKRSAT